MLLTTIFMAAAAPAVEPAYCAPPQRLASTALRQQVHRARAQIISSRAKGGRSATNPLLAPDVLIMPEFQPTLRGRRQVAAYARTMRERHGFSNLSARTSEILDLGTIAIETGAFTMIRGGERRGKYMAVWERRPTGLRLLAEASGYVHAVQNAAADVMLMPAFGTAPTVDAGSPELRTLNARMENAVRSRDARARTDFFAPDAVFMPFADTPKDGLEAIRQHLTEYNRGDVVVGPVRIWTERYRQAGRYIVEYPRFQAHWRAGDASGESSGKGIRLWWRAPDGALKICREIGNHDERAARG
ncbi:MAG TPA: DUF4440 domain-containing protein [Sphingomicrobium sp.]